MASISNLHGNSKGVPVTASPQRGGEEWRGGGGGGGGGGGLPIQLQTIGGSPNMTVIWQLPSDMWALPCSFHPVSAKRQKFHAW